MPEFIINFLTARWPELLGILITLSTGIVMPWLSRKSSNYKKIDKRLIVASLLHMVYLSVVSLGIMSIGVFILTFLIVLGVGITWWMLIAAYVALAIVTLLAFFGVMRWSKRMRLLLGKAKDADKKLYWMLTWVAVSSIVLSYVSLVFIGTELQDTAYRIALIISWALQIWWLVIIVAIIWKSAEYVYSTIKVTMLDGEVYHFDCSPKVCRVYRNYIRILKRDENNVVIQELQINEVAIKQIEYLKYGKLPELRDLVKIRQEQATDYDEVYTLVKTAFDSNPGTDGLVPDYLNGLREKDTFIPELSLVAEHENGRIIGQVVLYKTDITTPDAILTELVLSPISVHPDYFRQGIARAMMERAFEIAVGLGYRLVFLCGDPAFYRMIGFTPTFEHGIYHVNDKDKNAEWCMVRELAAGALVGVGGTVDIE